ncbi:hypothetical protein [Azospirillum sp. TSO5]|uniref:hypothetical protein n=1 Tax=Azospirillum sp. TSO5 TaxID=716760 RepID=UPI000D61763B|nr:hypothetical protein [Azospirillum sp. TSO5]PWC96906.1 hypothetical protein TSO5_05575 [Azospirillum sp. TSO5]
MAADLIGTARAMLDALNDINRVILYTRNDQSHRDAVQAVRKRISAAQPAMREAALMLKETDHDR